MNSAIYPDPSARRRADAAIGCPPFKTDSVWRRPDDETSSVTTVCPGVHTFATADGSRRVVWWDPFALDLGVEPAIGIRRESLIMKDVPETIVSEGVGEYEKWKARREEAIANGSVPSLAIRTATEQIGAGVGGAASAPVTGVAPQPGLFDEPAPVSTPPVPRSPSEIDISIVDARGPERPGGARFGELVHAILASAPLDADAGILGAAAEVHGRILSAAPDEITAAIATTERVLAHPVLMRARAADASGACRRETPVTIVDADGTLVEGIVDLAFHDGGGWTVVDYKTDRELRAVGEEQYRRQVELYASAIGKATGQSVAGVIVRV